jgi:hypothetical protein
MGSFGLRTAVPGRRVQEALRTALVFAAVGYVAYKLTLRYGDQPLVLAIVFGFGAFACSLLFTSERYALTLGLLMLYMGLLDGFLKLRYGGTQITAARDALLFSITGGALVRMAVRKTALTKPPLMGLVVAWCTIVVVEIFNPDHGTISHSIQALRQHIEWVPLFFFGFVIMRSKERLRSFFVMLLIITSINGAVALIQYEAGPDAVSGWGPGYAAIIKGTNKVSGRTFTTDSNNAATKKLRPLGLGSDVGFGGALALLAAPAAFAFIMLTRRRATQFAGAALAIGVVVAAVSSQTRLSVIGTVVSLGAVIGLSAASRRLAQGVVAALVVGVVAYAAIGSIGGHSGPGVFSRYSSISSNKVVDTSVGYKRGTFAFLPSFVAHHPFGVGLGSVGPASSVAGAPVDAGRISGESEFNALFAEVGIPGFAILLAFSLAVVVGSVTRIRSQSDPELRVLLAAVLAPLIALLVLWFGGPVSLAPPLAPYLWFASGILAYWCLGPGRAIRGRRTQAFAPAG